MTLKLMKHFGIKIQKQSGSLKIFQGNYNNIPFKVESDWSAAAFFCAWLALQTKGSIFFPLLACSGLQGDEVVLKFFGQFGLVHEKSYEGIHLTKIYNKDPELIEFDFTNCPDLFPPISIFCAIKKINSKFSGLQHLIYKESNRLQIINDFLKGQNVEIIINSDESISYQMELFDGHLKKEYLSHQDHRIAMAFSLLNYIQRVEILDPEVVNKSFPGYWTEFNKLI